MKTTCVNEPPVCKRCECEFTLTYDRPEVTDYCDGCAQEIASERFPVKADVMDGRITTLAEARAGFEREYIDFALTLADGRIGRAAELLGITRIHLHRKLRRYGVVVDLIAVRVGVDAECGDCLHHGITCMSCSSGLEAAT